MSLPEYFYSSYSIFTSRITVRDWSFPKEAVLIVTCTRFWEGRYWTYTYTAYTYIHIHGELLLKWIGMSQQWLKRDSAERWTAKLREDLGKTLMFSTARGFCQGWKVVLSRVQNEHGNGMRIYTMRSSSLVEWHFIPRKMFTFCALLCFVNEQFYPYPLAVNSLAPWQSHDSPSASEATLKNMGKCITVISI